SGLRPASTVSNRAPGKGLTRGVEIVPTATKAPTPSGASPAAELADQQLGCLAFAHLLDHHPRRLTTAPPRREIAPARAALWGAVANVDEACLLRRQGGALIPSAAALRASRSV